KAVAAIIVPSADWLRTVRVAAISPMFKVDEGYINLVAVPAADDGPLLLVAVVPIRNIDQGLLRSIHEEAHMSAVLMDENMSVLTAVDPSIIGRSVTAEGSNLKVRQVAQHYQQLGTAGTEIVELGFTLGNHVFGSGIVSMQPIQILGKRW